MKSVASSETVSKSSSGNDKLHWEMFKNVSCFVSPPNGLKPLKRTYANTPTDQISVFSDNGSYDRTWAEINKTI